MQKYRTILPRQLPPRPLADYGGTRRFERNGDMWADTPLLRLFWQVAGPPDLWEAILWLKVPGEPDVFLRLSVWGSSAATGRPVLDESGRTRLMGLRVALMLSATYCLREGYNLTPALLVRAINRYHANPRITDVDMAQIVLGAGRPEKPLTAHQQLALRRRLDELALFWYDPFVNNPFTPRRR